MHDVEKIMSRLRGARSLPELLKASFDAFEVIRIVARGSEDKVPALFAAFMSAADAAVDGRQALTLAPSLSPVSPITTPTVAGANIDTITVALAALGELLDEHLARSADRAPIPGDRTACQEAAEAGRRIHQLMASDGNDRHLR